MPRIWKVTTHHAGLIRHYYFGTKTAAKTFRREDNVEWEGADRSTTELNFETYPATAAGIAKALNDYIDMACLHEG